MSCYLQKDTPGPIEVNMTKTRTIAHLLGVMLLWIVHHSALAQDRAFEIGFRGMALLSKGEPANDMVTGSIVGSWQWRDNWFVGAALDYSSFDYEYPQRTLRIQQSPDVKAIDGLNTMTRVAGWVERRYDRPGAWDWYWSAGIGFASIDAPPVSGPTDTGGRFDIATEVSDELHLMTAIGLRRPVGENWSFIATFHLENHATDYKLTDRVSGTTGTIGSHSPVGISFTMGYRF